MCDILNKYGFKICTFLNLIKNLNNFYKKIENSNTELIQDLKNIQILDFFKIHISDLGSVIERTNFKNVDNLVKLLEFCLNDIEDISLLNGCSLLLDAQDRIQEFSTAAPIYKERKYEIFSGCLEKFLHKRFRHFSLVHFTKQIHIEDLSILLPFAIDRGKYHINMKSQFSFKKYPLANEELLKKLYEIWKIIENSNDIKSNSCNEYVKIRLLLLANWTIIPVKFNNDEKIHLAPINSINLILLHFRTSSLELQNLFAKLNLPFLARPDFPILRNIVVNLDDLKDLLNIFNFICNKKIDLIKNLKKEERSNFLTYLTSKLIKYEKDYGINKQQIVRLKLFENAFDEIISIENKTVIIIDSNIPLNGLQEVFPSTNYYLAYKDEYLNNIYLMLGIETFNLNEFYEKYLDELNIILSFQNKNIHLTFIKESGFISDQLILKLKKFNFIKSTTGEILSADKFYDPTNKFFKIIYRNDIKMFPTQPYDTDAWIEFLYRIGLKRFGSINNSINGYLQIAIDIFDEKNLNDSLFVFSKLFKIILGLDKNQNVITIENLTNSIDCIVRNINVERIKDIQELRPTFHQIYSILNSIFNSVDQNHVASFFDKIKQFNLVLHEFENTVNETKLIKLSPIDIFIEKNLRKHEQIEGYLFIFPDYWFEFKDLFSHLGLNSELNYEIVVKILSKLKNEENFELSKAINAMNLLFKSKSPEYLIDETLDLYLLNGNMKLIKSSELYYIDKEDLNHLYKTDLCKNSCLLSLEVISEQFSKYKYYNNKWHKIIDKLFKQHQPKIISNLIRKKIMVTSDSIMNEEDVEMTNKIKNEKFIASLKKLFNEESNEINEFLMKIKCYKPNQLFTESYFRNQRIARSEINEKTWTKFDDTHKTIIFYRNIRSPYISSKNLCDGIVTGIEKYFYENDGYINKSTKETIIDILLEKDEDKYELLLNEHKQFEF